MMERLYAFAENNKITGKLISFQRSWWYPAVFAVLTVLACSFDLDIIFIYLIMLSTVFAALFGRDFKPVLVTLFFAYFSFALHGDVTKLDLSQYEWGYSTAQLVQLIICAGLFISAIIFRLAASGELRRGIKRHAFTAGILALCTAFWLNGLFYENYSVDNIIMALIETASFLPLYYIVLCGIPKGDKTLLPYICKLCAIAAAIILAELLILIIKLAGEGVLMKEGALNRDHIVLGWGVNNLICSMLTMFVAPVMYLAYSTKKYGPLYIVYAAAMIAMIFIVQSRAALLFAAFMFVVCLVICCFSGENKKVCRIAAIIVAAAGVAIIIFLAATGYLSSLFTHLFGGDGQTLDNGRFMIWKQGWANFLKNPVFGAGFGESAYPPEHVNYGTAFLTQNHYHNIGVQIIASMGIAGVLAFCVHAFEVVRFYIKNRHNAGVLFMGLTLVSVLLLSLLDNMFFFPCFAIYYVMFLAVSEIDAHPSEATEAVEAAEAESERV